MKILNVSVGADPELFLKDSTGKFISSIGLIGGSKEAPKPISDYGHAIQEDNVAVEFNIPPCQTAFGFVDNIKYVLNHLESLPLNLELAVVPSVVFDADQLDNEAAQTFGCDPDYNAYTGDENPRPEAGEGGRLRTAGGHIHVGYSDSDEHSARELVKAMDLFLAIPSMFMDSDTRRRTMYGNAGAFRKKSYGVEYRTLSNFWIANERLMTWAFENTMKAIEFVNQGKEVDRALAFAINKAIKTDNKEIAQRLVNDFKLEVL